MQIPHRARLLLTIFLLFFWGVAQGEASDYRIGVYYWPGWKSPAVKSGRPSPWDKIKPFPEREPLLGWYPEGEQWVMDQQLAWMKKYGLNYVVFSETYSPRGVAQASYAIDTYLRSTEREGIPFAVQWANHDKMPQGYKQFDATIISLLSRFASKKEYMKIDGKPLIFIFSSIALERDARGFGSSAAELVARARSIAKKMGYVGLYIVGSGANDAATARMANEAGFDAISAYNYHNAPRAKGGSSTSYPEMDAGYQENWNIVTAAATVDFIVPMTSGWDRRPWGGTPNNPAHDNSMGSPVEFLQHLQSAKAFIDAHRNKTKGMGIICCWNEFGEGSYIEPTKTESFARLTMIHKVFSTSAQSESK